MKEKKQFVMGQLTVVQKTLNDLIYSIRSDDEPIHFIANDLVKASNIISDTISRIDLLIEK